VTHGGGSGGSGVGEDDDDCGEDFIFNLLQILS
jgi:hypothetical protein